MTTALAIAASGAWLRTAEVTARAAPIQTEPFSAVQSGLSDEDFPELEDAKKKFQARDVAGALEILKVASQKYPVLPPARVMLARMMFSANQAAAAAGALEQAVMETPDDPEPYLTLGDVAIQSRRFTEAGLLFEKADELSEQFSGDETRHQNMRVRVQAGLASVAEAHRNWTDARQHLDAWLELDPQSAAARHRLGRTLFGLATAEEDKEKQKGTYNAAWEALKAAAETDESLSAPAVTMGILYEQAGNRDRAKQWMDYAAKSAPDELRTRMGIATWYWQINQPADAEPHLEAAVKIDGDSLEAKLLSGLVAHALKKMSQAEDFFESAHLQSPSNFMAANQLCLALADQEDRAKQRRALEMAQMNARQHPRRADAAATLGWVLYLNGRVTDAAQMLRTAASGGKISPETAYYLARLESGRGQGENAQKWLDAALGSSTPFIHRSDAQQLRDQMASAETSSGGEPPPSNGATP